MTYTIVSFSGGKDSTAMLLHMIELGEHIDEVVNIDTGMEYPAMYDHIDKVREIVDDAGIPFVKLKSAHSFELEDSRIKRGLSIDTPGFYQNLGRLRPLPDNQTRLEFVD